MRVIALFFLVAFCGKAIANDTIPPALRCKINGLPLRPVIKKPANGGKAPAPVLKQEANPKPDTIYVVDGILTEAATVHRMEGHSIESVQLLDNPGMPGCIITPRVVIAIRTRTKAGFIVRDGTSDSVLKQASVRLVHFADTLNFVANEISPAALKQMKSGARYRLQISHVGYESVDTVITFRPHETYRINLKQRSGSMEEVVIHIPLIRKCSYPFHCLTRICCYMNAAPVDKEDSTRSVAVQVFPNPVPRSGNVNIRTGAGSGTIELFNSSGQVLSRMAFSMPVVSMPVPPTNGGTYLLRVSNSQTGTANTTKLVVQ